MSRLSTALFLVACATVPASACAETAQDFQVGFGGYGPVRIGMHPGDMQRVLGIKLARDDVYAGEDCEYVTAPGYEGVAFMLINDRLVRIDISAPAVKTRSGAHVGTSQADVLAMYPGRVEVTPHFYNAPDGAYLTLLSADKRYGIRFETDLHRVESYYMGTAEAIQYVEGCQ